MTFDDPMPVHTPEAIPVTQKIESPAAEPSASDLDRVEFARKRLLLEPDERQIEVLRSNANRGILNCSRQWGKSTTAGGQSRAPRL